MHYEPAHYPGTARIANIEGSAQVVVHVGSLGQVTSVTLKNVSHPIFRRSAKLAAWCSKFSPAMVNGSATEDSIQLDYVFRLSEEQKGTKKQLHFENREQLVELIDNQVCLYGNWLSGPVYVRISEDRVYVGGIRVHPDIQCFNKTHHPELAFPEVLKEQLVFECRLLERELSLRGNSIEKIRAETLIMLQGIPMVRTALLLGSSSIDIETVDCGLLSVTLPDPRDTELYFTLQPQMSPADGSYYGWLASLHVGMGGFQMIASYQVTSKMSLFNQNGIAMREFVRSAEKNENGGIDWPLELGELPESLVEAIRNPVAVKRL